MKKVILLTFGAAAILSSCKKDSTNKNCGKTMADIAGTYSIVKIEASFGGAFTEVTDLYLDSCQLDDKATLNANGTAIYTDAGTKCSSDGSTTGTWSSSNGKVNIEAGSIDITNADIASFDCSTLVALYTDPATSAQARITIKK